MTRRDITRMFGVAAVLLMGMSGAGGPITAVLSGTSCLAQGAPATGSGPALMKQADALAAAGKYQQAAVAYGSAGKAFAAQGKNEEQAQALEKSAAMYEKWADQLKSGKAPVTAPSAPASRNPVVAPPVPPSPEAPARGGAAPLPLTASPIVTRNAHAALVVATKAGHPVDGLKLSRFDMEIHSPSICVAPNGAIHVAFLEKHSQPPYEMDVYHRSSSDGGKTWSSAKNLSEVMPDIPVGNCQVISDPAGRVYVIWRTALAPNFSADIDPHSYGGNNLVFRVLENGQWSGGAIPVHPPHVKGEQQLADASWFVCLDPTGKVHVIWNLAPSQLLNHNVVNGVDYSGLDPGLGRGRVMEAVLDGRAASAPREIYMAKVTGAAPYGRVCDSFDTINGYVDAGGQAHFVAKLEATVAEGSVPNRILLIENRTQTPAIVLPGPVFATWQYPPTLLLDARGQRHIIAMYSAGEQPNIRDYRIGSTAEPTVIRAAKEVTGKVQGFQACQAPGGQMIVLMQMNDSGKMNDGDLYLSTSDGGKWSSPVNVTNNTGRSTFFAHQTSFASHVAGFSTWYPGPAAATYDRQGHLLLLYISVKRSVFESSALGVTLAGGSTATPNLLFLRF